MGYSSSNDFSINYDYDNLFDAESFSFSFLYKNQKNTLIKSFIEQQNGISEYELFLANNIHNFKVTISYSKITFPLKYPIKINLSLMYEQVNYPYKAIQQNADITDKNIIPKFSVETITDHFLNFSLSSKVSINTNEIQNISYKSTYINSSFSVLLKNKALKGNISFLYDNNLINDILYSRKNINIGFSYTVR